MSEVKFVKNNVVKMDWRTDGWYTRSWDKWFAFATQVYDGIPVFFSGGQAFLFVDDATKRPVTKPDMYSPKELANYLGKKSNEVDPDSFPYDFDDNVIVIADINNGEECDTSALEELGVGNLDTVSADIINRLKDLAPFNDEVEVTMDEMLKNMKK